MIEDRGYSEPGLLEFTTFLHAFLYIFRNCKI